MDCPWNPPGQNTGVGTLSLLQGFLPTQGSNLGLPHCRWILYQLRHNGSPRIQEWVAYPFSSGSSPPRNQTGSHALQADSLPIELSEKPIEMISYNICLLQIWKTQQWPQDWKRSVFIPIPKKGNAKECSNYITTVQLHSFHTLIK